MKLGQYVRICNTPVLNLGGEWEVEKVRKVLKIFA